jgi:hypothetical protein
MNMSDSSTIIIITSSHLQHDSLLINTCSLTTVTVLC